MQHDESDINITIADAIDGNENSLDDLMTSTWLDGILDGTSTRQANKFQLDSNEIRAWISDQLRKNIQTIKNKHKPPLTKTVKAWCNSTGKGFCLNKKRHYKVESRYVERVIHENTHGKRKSPKGGTDIQGPTTDSPEDIMVEQEMNSLWARRMTNLHLDVYNIITKLPPKDIEIALLWAEGFTFKQIACTTGIPLSTAQRHLKNFQKEILRSIGVEQLIAENAELLAGVHELIANCLLEMNSVGHFPPHAA
jgi:DNA-binding CsgD family transcriptional regulator